MNTNLSHVRAKEFLTNYFNSITLDFKALEQLLNSIHQAALTGKNCNTTSKVMFIESGDFELTSVIKENNICINKSRFSAIHKINLDCHHRFHENWVNAFYSTTKDNKNKLHEEQIFIDYLNNNPNWQDKDKRFKIGSIRTTPYELLDTVYKNGQYIYQKNYLERLFSGLESPPTENHKMVLLFTSIYDYLLNSLQENKILVPFTHSSYITPSIIDAVHTSMNEINQVRKKYFPLENMFCLYFINANVIPNNINAQDITKSIVDQYNNLFNLYINSSFANSNLNHIHNFIIKNIATITELFTKKIEEIQLMTDIAHERLSAINNPYLIY